MNRFRRLSVLVLICGLLLVYALPAAAAAPLPQTQPTPAAPQAQPAQPAVSGSPWLAVVILGAPLVFMAWRATRKKKIEITGSSCLPVIDESKRPFKPIDDD